MQTQSNPDDLAGWIAPWVAGQLDAERQRAARVSMERRALEEAEMARDDRAAEPVPADATEGQISDLARRRAWAMAEEIKQHPGRITRRWLCWLACSLEANPLPPLDPEGPPLADQLQAMVARVTCRHWWRRQLRRAAGLKREAAARAAGRVSRTYGAPYVTNDSATRYERQQARSRAMLERTRLVSEDGEEITLLAAFEAGTGNPAIRRGELMTRIKGCEEWATAQGMVGEFATLTTPSRFHSTKHTGKKNPEWAGATPKDGQQWLCGMWAKARAALARRGLGILGFRIAEPHHDGTPHWHALWWAPAEQAEEIREIVAHYWLSDGGREPGAGKHRAKFERIDPRKGGACAYLAKYIAKNIDDAGAVGAEGHRDEAEGVQMEIEGGSNGYARRVAAWASLHGIRQFQALGQPPVTVWRELRRIPEATRNDPACLLAAALAAVHRDGERRACWRGYMAAQGGAMLRRGDYRLQLATQAEKRDGLYGPTLAARPLGVTLAGYGITYASERKAWRPKSVDLVDWFERRAGTLAALAMVSRAVHRNEEPSTRGPLLGNWGFSKAEGRAAWTRLNNCTHRGAQAGASGNPNRGPGGRQTAERQKDPPPWTTKPPRP